jgi:voltage-gated potassium channel
VLVLGGVSVGVYTFGVFFEALIEGRLTTHLERIRMQRHIDALNDHIIICGFGQVGQAIAESIRSHGPDVVVVDTRDDIHEHTELYTIRGDATDDEVLMAAGIERARGLVTALNTDADNLFVVITARQIKPSLHIVARANEGSSIKKLEAGGADRVVNPHRIGGARMASYMVQPNVADFVGESMTGADYEVRLAEVTVREGSGLDGATIGASGVRESCGITILAVRRDDGGFEHQPTGATVTDAGDVIIALGTPEQQQLFRSWLDDSVQS